MAIRNIRMSGAPTSVNPPRGQNLDLARAMVARGTSSEPVLTPLAGLGRLAGGISGQLQLNRAEKQQQAQGEQLAAALQSAIPQGMDPQQQALLAAVIESNPQAASQLLAGQLFQKPQGLMNVAPGASIFDPNTGQAAFTAPPKSDVLSPERVAQKIDIANQTAEARAGAQNAANANSPLALLAKQQGEASLALSNQKLEKGQQEAAAAVTAKAEDEKRKLAGVQTLASHTEDLNTTIDEAFALVNSLTTGFPGQILKNIGGTEAADLFALIDTLEANLAFGALNEMRAQSKTGGALGAISERELRLLGSTVRSLKQAQTAPQVKRALEKVRQRFNRILDAARKDAGSEGQGQNALTITINKDSSDDDVMKVLGF